MLRCMKAFIDNNTRISIFSQHVEAAENLMKTFMTNSTEKVAPGLQMWGYLNEEKGFPHLFPCCLPQSNAQNQVLRGQACFVEQK